MENYLEGYSKIPDNEKELIREFYAEIISCFDNRSEQKKTENKIQLVVVTHAVPTVPFYLEALSKIGEVVAIVLKGSEKDEKIEKWLLDSYPGKIVTKSKLGDQLAPSESPFCGVFGNFSEDFEKLLKKLLKKLFLRNKRKHTEQKARSDAQCGTKWVRTVGALFVCKQTELQVSDTSC